MAKAAKKKRAAKYEPKLKINATFDGVLKLSVTDVDKLKKTAKKK
jgi:hypothetical protein